MTLQFILNPLSKYIVKSIISNKSINRPAFSTKLNSETKSLPAVVIFLTYPFLDNYLSKGDFRFPQFKLKVCQMIYYYLRDHFYLFKIYNKPKIIKQLINSRAMQFYIVFFVWFFLKNINLHNYIRFIHSSIFVFNDIFSE